MGVGFGPQPFRILAGSILNCPGPALGDGHDGGVVGQPRRFVAGEVANAIGFFLGLGEDTIMLLLDPLRFLDLFRDGQDHLIDQLKTAFGVHQAHLCARDAAALQQDFFEAAEQVLNVHRTLLSVKLAESQGSHPTPALTPRKERPRDAPRLLRGASHGSENSTPKGPCYAEAPEYFREPAFHTRVANQKPATPAAR